MCRETAEERAARIERDRQREAMRKQREKDNRLKQAGRRTRAEREAERDISERIALGQAAIPTATGVTFDSRLYDQIGGLGSGMVADDGKSFIDWFPLLWIEYHVYTKPLFEDRSTNIYKVRDHD